MPVRWPDGRGVLQAWRAAWQRAAAYLLVPLGYFAGAKFGVLYTVMPEGTAILWPPNSVLLAALLLRRGRGAFVLGLLVIGAEVAADLPVFSLTEALLFGLVNVSEALLAYGLLARCRFDLRLQRLRDLNCFLLAGPVVAALAAAFAGAAVYSRFRGSEVGYLQFVRIWWFGDALGLLVFTPMFLGLAQGLGGALARWRARPPRDWLALALAAGAVAGFLASHHAMFAGLVFAPVLLLPFALLLASRFDLGLVCAGSAAMAMTLIVTLTQGGHPFGPLPAREAVLRTQEFVFILGLVPLGLGALLAQLRSRQCELESANERLNSLNRELESRVQERTARLDALNADLQRLAMLDPLTGLPNRRAFFDRARQAFEHRRRHPAALSVLMIDIDHFKAVNDRYGHAAGDAVLAELARRMALVLRPQDTLARHGGEEFSVLAPDASLQGAEQLGQRLHRAVVEHPVIVDGQPLAVTVSIGVAACAPDDTLEASLRRADEALYAAKAQGRNRVVTAAPDRR